MISNNMVFLNTGTDNIVPLHLELDRYSHIINFTNKNENIIVKIVDYDPRFNYKATLSYNKWYAFDKIERDTIYLTALNPPVKTFNEVMESIPIASDLTIIATGKYKKVKVYGAIPPVREVTKVFKIRDTIIPDLIKNSKNNKPDPNIPIIKPPLKEHVKLSWPAWSGMAGGGFSFLFEATNDPAVYSFKLWLRGDYSGWFGIADELLSTDKTSSYPTTKSYSGGNGRDWHTVDIDMLVGNIVIRSNHGGIHVVDLKTGKSLYSYLRYRYEGYGDYYIDIPPLSELYPGVDFNRL